MRELLERHVRDQRRRARVHCMQPRPVLGLVGRDRLRRLRDRHGAGVAAVVVVRRLLGRPLHGHHRAGELLAVPRRPVDGHHRADLVRCLRAGHLFRVVGLGYVKRVDDGMVHFKISILFAILRQHHELFLL